MDIAFPGESAEYRTGREGGDPVRVARLHAAGDLRVSEEPVPEPAPGMSLVRVTVVGICGSDLHWWDEGAIGDAGLAHPLVLGHEGAGVIAGGPRRGERVAIDPAIACDACRACRSGFRNLCYRIRFSGHGETDGMTRELMTWPSALLYPLPDSLSDTDGALLEPLGVALHSADLGHLRLGGTASVVGCGPIGLLLIGPHPTTEAVPPSGRCPRSAACSATPSGSSSAPSVSDSESGNRYSSAEGQLMNSRIMPSVSPWPANLIR